MTLAKHIVAQDDECFSLQIAVNTQFAGVQINSITMHIAKQADEDGYYCDGDLAVNWSMQGLTNNEDARTMGTLLLRNKNSNDAVTNVMGKFYWEDGFTEELQDLLIAAGFSTAAALDVSTSEWGMQDEERASYDATLIADEVRAVMLQTA